MPLLLVAAAAAVYGGEEEQEMVCGRMKSENQRPVGGRERGPFQIKDKTSLVGCSFSTATPAEEEAASSTSYLGLEK